MAHLEVEWRHLVADGNTCDRCDLTGNALRATLASLHAELTAQGHAVSFKETPLGTADLAQSNLILLNGRALEDWLGASSTETHCASCCDLIGAQVCCRAVDINGTVYEAIPDDLIRTAALAALNLEVSTMKTIKVLGTGCRNCETTAKLIEEIAAARGVAIELEKVTDMAAILGYGVMSTPGVVIDGQVVHAGGVPDRKKIEGWLG
jgi:small redox-active disulfide protein 2